MKYLQDLGITPDDIRTLILSTLVSSPTLGTLNRSDFISGWLNLAQDPSTHPTMDSTPATQISTQNTTLSTIAGAFRDPGSSRISNPEYKKRPSPMFKRVYKHTFTLALPEGNNVRAIPLDEAAEYWRLLLGPNGYNWRSQTRKGNATPWLEWWLSFLQEKWRKAVNRDLWEQTLAFAQETSMDDTLGFWSEDAAWPGVIDEFVEWVRQKRDGEGLEDKMEVG